MTDRSPSPSVPLARSSTLRLVSAIALVFVAAGAILAVAVWSTVSTYTERRILDALQTDAAGLEAVWREGGTAALARVVARRGGETAADGVRRVRLVVGPDGEKIVGDFEVWPNDLGRADTATAQKPDDGARAGVVTFRGPDDVAYAGVLRHIDGGPDLLVAHDRTEHEAVMRALGRDLALPMLAALVATGIVTLVVGRRLLDRVERVNLTARRVEAGDLTARVAGEGSDEFGRLAAHVNAMLERIAALVGGVHHLSDQIAHETRTPLARLRSRLERARREAEATPAARPLLPALDDAIGETAELISVFSALLDIARTEAAAGDARGLAPADLAAIVADVADLYEAVAEDRGIRLAISTTPAIVLGERMLLTRMVANLVDNAVKYSPDGAVVDLTVEAIGGEFRLAVRDRGPGLPDGFEAAAFERFTRAESVAAVPGHGLGLPLVRAVALRHGMKITLERAGPGLRAVVVARRAGL
ncbi:MAG: HAMP domain-containing histidine kinase [Phyllobacteriaceae bacterium]|nr:HAMP domain-containing histidine kinase [Phyllobacteriaceae bacterium]